PMPASAMTAPTVPSNAQRNSVRRLSPPRSAGIVACAIAASLVHPPDRARPAAVVEQVVVVIRDRVVQLRAAVAVGVAVRQAGQDRLVEEVVPELLVDRLPFGQRRGDQPLG